MRCSFGLRALLLLVACCAVLAGAYRVGFDRGYRSGTTARKRAAIVVVTYDVDDLGKAMQGGNGLGELTEFLSEAVGTHAWEVNGGVGRIDFLNGSTLVITQSLAAHDRIAELLESAASQSGRAWALSVVADVS